MTAIEANTRDAGGRDARRLHRVVDLVELRVGAASDERDRHVQFAEPAPQGFLRTGTEPAQSGGEIRGRVAGGSIRDSGRARIEGGEERLGEPIAQERLDAPFLDVGRQLLVADGAARSLASAMPGDALTSTSRSTRSGRSSASRRQSRPPIE